MNRLPFFGLGVLAFVAVGCSSYQIKYQAFIKNRISPATNCAIIDGKLEEAKRLMEVAQLPHNVGRTRYEMLARANDFTSQLGSNDYVLIGEAYGGGNGRTNLEGLKGALASRAAQRGGDVIMVVKAGIVDQPYSFSTPGYATTSLYGNTAYTTYMPGQTYSGIAHFPRADALVFKYVPGKYEQIRSRFKLDDNDLDRIEHSAAALSQDPSLSFEEAQAQLHEDFIEVQSESATRPAQGQR